MPNTYFRFKQFRVEQDKCAMKVCTDACILGATADANGAKKLLDIGTGTGLLSLMMAQRFPALIIDAVEIDPPAAEQAAENFKDNPWANRLTCIECDIINLTLSETYDHIICNPPFYEEHLKPENKSNIIARHSEQLTLEELAEKVHHFLSPAGKFSVLLPPDAMNRLEAIFLSKKIYLNKQLLVSDRKELPVIRVVGEFSFNKSTLLTNTLMINNNAGQYTVEFKNLLQDFYLAF